MPTELHTRREDGHELSLLVWRFPDTMRVASTAACGGGLRECGWVLNAQVARDYARRDQHTHGAELAAALNLTGEGVVLFTAADVREVRHAADGGVDVGATVGITHPTWAADADDAVSPWPGTINVVALVPVPVSDAALLNALCTATEAKTQALLEAGVPGTGTASDAVTIACPRGGAELEPFAGPRSVWGARLARAVYAAVLAGARPD